jgi:hypothetical protein
MGNFTTRVELHGANWSDYEALHREMAARGFSQQIISSAGQTYKLPPAEYTYSGAETKEAILAKAKEAASRVKSSYAVLVTEWGSCTWYGLEAA